MVVVVVFVVAVAVFVELAAVYKSTESRQYNTDHLRASVVAFWSPLSGCVLICF